jgi:hypothetical protein
MRAGAALVAGIQAMPHTQGIAGVAGPGPAKSELECQVLAREIADPHDAPTCTTLGDRCTPVSPA